MIPILVAAMTGGSVTVAVAIVRAEWTYLLAAPLVASALALLVAVLLATRRGSRAENALDDASPDAAVSTAGDMANA